MIRFLLFCMLIWLGSGHAQNLISNGDFEGGATGWSSSAGNGGTATFVCPTTGDVHAGSGSLRANVTAVGANAWDVQTIQSGFTATIGATHTLTFWARATVAGRAARIVLQNTTYTSQDFALTTTWAQYSFNFIPTEASLQLKIHYFQTGDFRFDDFVINDPSGPPPTVTSVLTPSTKYQNMIGFGGALTWYAERVTASASKKAICDLMFTDLGLDIMRLKNWYYPQSYPSVKSPATMNPSWFKTEFDATNDFYTQAKNRNSAIEVLLCSWSPPQSLKTNGLLPEGTLTKSGGNFQYKEFAQYWSDVLDNISFVPDYISIQNEPGFVTSGWETCEWRPTETSTLPGMDVALDSVYNKIKNRPTVPKILAPEPENLGGALWNGSLNTFREFANPIKNKAYLFGYNYHLYNYAGGAGSIAPANLNIIRDEFGNHPAIMSEFSSENYNWIDVARMVHANLVEANAAAYIYWELVWDMASPSTMIGVDASGNYTVKDNYYSIKHYAKYIDKGYTRIAATGSNATLNLTAFQNPAGNQITVVVVNNHTSVQPLTVSLAGGATILSAQAYQSVVGNYWQNLGAVNLSTTQSLPAKSLTTYVINTTTLPVELLAFAGTSTNVGNLLNWKTVLEQNCDHFDILAGDNATSLEKIAEVAAKGNSVELQSYSYLDKDAVNTTRYYQLKTVDQDLSAAFSDVIKVSGVRAQSEPQHYPDPFSDKITLEIEDEWLGSNLYVYNTQGQQVLHQVIGAFSSYIELNALPPGIYYFTLKNGNNQAVFKSVKK